MFPPTKCSQRTRLPAIDSAAIPCPVLVSMQFVVRASRVSFRVALFQTHMRSQSPGEVPVAKATFAPSIARPETGAGAVTAGDTAAVPAVNVSAMSPSLTLPTVRAGC